jgi:endonuclease/exonuclease/phosphatase family metal-dependent hydrolase
MPRLRLPARAIAIAIACASIVSPAHALRVVTWNLINYPTSHLATRQPHLRTVFANIEADVLIVQELKSQAGRDSLLNNVLNVVEPGEWTAGGFILATESAIFWKPAKVGVTNISSFATAGPRDVYQCIVRPAGYLSNQAAMRIYSVHLKAGTATADSAERHTEASDIRAVLNSVNVGAIGPNFMIGGDFNIYRATESAYIRLTESQLDNDGRSKDPLLMPGEWNNNSGYALYMTQCPCANGCLSGYSGGGMDDRFDFWLTAYSMQDGEGLDWTGSGIAGYAAYGNDGQHFNTDINGDGFNSVVPIAVANALHDASDHLPVVIVLQIPARVSAPSVLAFGNVIVGANAKVALPVANGAAAPADELTYSYLAPAGFTAPGGTRTANAGAPANADSIGIDASMTGPKSGALLMTTDDPDSTSKLIPLSGTVIRHALASLDSTAEVTAALADFGEAQAGEFADLDVRIHNFGWDALQARLAAQTAIVTGGDDRFSIVADPLPALLEGVGRTLIVRFDDAGATADSTYEATLTIAGADEPLPGAAAANDLVVTLRAKPLSGSTGVPGGPTALRFEPPRPNPLTRGTRFAFELPEAASVSLEIFDLSGRRVSTLVDGERGPGRHEVRWNAANERGGRLAAGLYFARFRTAGLSAMERLIVLP